VPSNTARGGGILAPTVRALAAALGSTPERDPDRAGSYLATGGPHACCISGAMFLPGMAANALVSRAAADVFAIDFGWTRWALGAIVPGLVALAVLPWVVHRLGAAEAEGARREDGRRVAARPAAVVGERLDPRLSGRAGGVDRDRGVPVRARPELGRH